MTAVAAVKKSAFGSLRDGKKRANDRSKSWTIRAGAANLGPNYSIACSSWTIVTKTRDDGQRELDRERLADLVNAIAAHKDRTAFAEVFGFFGPRIKAYLMKLGSDASQAEELTQDVMLTVWRKAELFDRRQASVSTWVFTIARNRRIDLLRREGRPALDPEDPLLTPEPERAPDDAVVLAQREERLHAAIVDLPKEQADLLQLAFFQAKSHREIADETGIPLGTVKSRLRLAFGRLRGVLEDEI